MPVVGGLDIHRKQITFDYLDTATGELRRGQIAPADRAHLAAWLARRFGACQDADFALEGCTGWRYPATGLLIGTAAARSHCPAVPLTPIGATVHETTVSLAGPHRARLRGGLSSTILVPTADRG